MKDSLKTGIKYSYKFSVPKEKVVARLYPESEEFQVMPAVFATGFLVGLIEWTCIKAINPHLDWPNEQTVGTYVDVSHLAATPPEMDVTVNVELVEIDGRRLVFEITATDEFDVISKGRHERHVINKAKFDRKVEDKANAKGSK